ncbi:hypothetical protein [Vulcanisaeta thermophila]|nr:hypothetical protein [Vulcanisaeta thermophila]
MVWLRSFNESGKLIIGAYIGFDKAMVKFGLDKVDDTDHVLRSGRL